MKKPKIVIIIKGNGTFKTDAGTFTIPDGEYTKKECQAYYDEIQQADTGGLPIEITKSPFDLGLFYNE